MRTLKTIILMAALLLAYTCRSHAQTQPFNSSYRDVYWMHGINGDEQSMQALAEYFGKRCKINSYHPKYPSTQGIDYAASYWRNYNFGRRTDNFVITHSMGGLVARYYDQHYATGNQFGGLITMAAPHRGSQFANSFDDGRVKYFLEGMTVTGLEGFEKAIIKMPLVTLVLGSTDRLIRDLKEEYEKLRPTAEKTLSLKTILLITKACADIISMNSVDLFTSNILTSITTNNVTNLLKGLSIVLVSTAGEHVFGEFHYSIPIGTNEIKYYSIGKDELKYDSPIISSINNGKAFHSPNTINLVSQVTGDNVGMKLMGSTLCSKDLTSHGESSIGKIYDHKLQEFINVVIKKSQTLSENFEKVGNASGVGAIVNIILGFGEPISTINAIKLLSERANCKEIAAAFSRQAYFWKYAFEQRYHACLGNKYYTTSTETYYERVWVDHGPGHGAKPIESHDGPIDFIEYPIIGDDSPGSNNGHWEYIPRTYTVTHTHTYDSDGIVTAPSQETWKASKTLYIEDVDHEKVKRAQNTINVFTEIFLGKHGKFFELEGRPTDTPAPKPIKPKPGLEPIFDDGLVPIR